MEKFYYVNIIVVISFVEVIRAGAARYARKLADEAELENGGGPQ